MSCNGAVSDCHSGLQPGCLQVSQCSLNVRELLCFTSVFCPSPPPPFSCPCLRPTPNTQHHPRPWYKMTFNVALGVMAGSQGCEQFRILDEHLGGESSSLSSGLRDCSLTQSAPPHSTCTLSLSLLLRSPPFPALSSRPLSSLPLVSSSPPQLFSSLGG